MRRTRRRNYKIQSFMSQILLSPCFQLFGSIGRDPKYNVRLFKPEGRSASWTDPLADRCGWDHKNFLQMVNDVIGQIWIVDKSGNTDTVDKAAIGRWLNQPDPEPWINPWLNSSLNAELGDPNHPFDFGSGEWYRRNGIHGITWAAAGELGAMVASGEEILEGENWTIGVGHIPGLSCENSSPFCQSQIVS